MATRPAARSYHYVLWGLALPRVTTILKSKSSFNSPIESKRPNGDIGEIRMDATIGAVSRSWYPV